jgi:PhnB protein
MSQLYLSPYINFGGRAQEAMKFYQSVLGGTLDLLTGGEGGVPRPAEAGEPIMHSHLAADGITIMGSDGHPDYPATLGDAIALALGGTDRERIEAAFNGLAEGGTIKMPLMEQPWGSSLGFLVDKFGINWMVSIDPS